MEVFLILLVLVALAVLIAVLRAAAPREDQPVIRLIEVENSTDEDLAEYQAEQRREEESLRRWRASLRKLDIGFLEGWTLLIDHRRSHPEPKFRPVRLQSISYDEGGGLYLVGQCLKRNERRHFGMDSIHGYADASTKKKFATFEAWAASQGVAVDLRQQVEQIEQEQLEAFWASQDALTIDEKEPPRSDQD